MPRSLSNSIDALTTALSEASTNVDYYEIKEQIETLLAVRPLLATEFNRLESLYQIVLAKTEAAPVANKEIRKVVNSTMTIPQLSIDSPYYNIERMYKIMIKNKIYNTVELMSLDFVVEEA